MAEVCLTNANPEESLELFNTPLEKARYDLDQE